MHSASVQCYGSYVSDIVETTAASSWQQGLRSSMDTFIYSSTDFHQVRRTGVLVAGLSVWNILPADILRITDIILFKRYLMTHILNFCFNTFSFYVMQCVLYVYVLVVLGYTFNSVVCQWTPNIHQVTLVVLYCIVLYCITLYCIVFTVLYCKEFRCPLTGFELYCLLMGICVRTVCSGRCM